MTSVEHIIQMEDDEEKQLLRSKTEKKNTVREN